MVSTSVFTIDLPLLKRGCSPRPVIPWTMGRYQALAFAKIWSHKARLPNATTMWEMYPGPKTMIYKTLPGQFCSCRILSFWTRLALRR